MSSLPAPPLPRLASSERSQVLLHTLDIDRLIDEKRTYVSRRCPYVKVDVEFRESGIVVGKPDTFIIISLSRLYVDYPKSH
jgi:hypothetical protein